jgi:pyruvate dehydrogenase E2 component (dihydrolipoamide acetyltransferase)
MAQEFKIPELGENVTSGDVVRILVKSGDTLEKDQPVLELETDKATIEVPSTVEGTVQDVKVKQGDKVKVGQLVLTVDGDGAAAETPAEKGEAAEAPRAAEEERGAERPKPKPQPAGSVEAGGLSQAAPGQAEPVESAPDPQGAQKGAAERDRGTTGSAPAKTMEGGGAARDEQQRETEETAEPETRQKPRGEVVAISRGSRSGGAAPATPDAPASTPAPAAPSVRRLARELGVDIHAVPGSGEGGRISVDDVRAFVRSALGGGAAQGGAAGSAAPAAPLPDFARWGAIERKPMSNIRRRTAEHLSNAWRTIPHVTQHDKADITALEDLRQRYSPQAEKAGGKLTVTAIALKIAAGALKRFPQFNASIDVGQNEIVHKSSVHVGVAVDTERGLLVPVVRNVDRKGIIELSVELAGLSEKARAGKLSLEEMQGGGFTITNLGGIGGTSFTPIVNWPEVAILGISRGAYEPHWDGEQFGPKLMLPFSLSYDHRVIDGADAARFLRWICEAFEQPFVIAL